MEIEMTADGQTLIATAQSDTKGGATIYRPAILDADMEVVWVGDDFTGGYNTRAEAVKAAAVFIAHRLTVAAAAKAVAG